MSQTKPNIFGISNPFVQVNISKEANTASYDNAELISMSDNVYTFAQQEVSRLLPHMANVQSINGLFVNQDRFGKFEFRQKTKNIEDTPHTVHANSTRSMGVIQFVAGHWLSREDVHNTRYAIQPQVQRQLGYAMGRDMDEVIMQAFYKPVLNLSTTASATFAGVASSSTTNLPFSRIKLLGSKQTSNARSVVHWSEFAIDELIEDFEKLDWDLNTICIVMTPDVRRSLKRIPGFRDAENNTSFRGNENSMVLSWKGLKFIAISDSIKPPRSVVAGNVRVQQGSQFASVEASSGSTSGYSAFSGYTGYGNAKVTFAFSSSAFKVGFPKGYTNFMRIDERLDKSYAVQLYATHSIGCLRVDDDGVMVIIYGDEALGSNDDQ